MSVDHENVRKALQKEADAYRGHQAELSKLATTKRDLTARQQETETVLEELKLLDDEANVFKAVGPVLVKQDLMEARTNVTNRLEFIKKDIERLDNQIKGVESKMLDREREIMKLQKKLQGAAGDPS
ncbi:Prefoldin subunit 6 [Pleodorina starrii]|uniref:Prefoldin subunit 6 n=1 Tax=Pleodorina starrii TaxID=330485 RepID=A0A9W6BMJ0_9CHLO|nr:Prefoldin subunit 6 [Pleodorina starrii]GLC54932.1 Prefoldin subunit 6 [Pleodorina starrii]GLC73621.1 Prefoldin subunit 6 [Pleodorina starrii]